MLGKLGYNSDPNKLQTIIRKVFKEGVSNIHLEGTQVIPFPLYEVLDGKTHSDYEQRVEPSISGGEKIGYAFMNVITNN